MKQREKDSKSPLQVDCVDWNATMKRVDEIDAVHLMEM